MQTFSWSRIIVDEQELEDTPIRSLFQRCYSGHKHLAELPSDADQAQTLLRKLLRMLQHCDIMVDTTGLFSDNEHKDDIATSSLRYVSRLRVRAVHTSLACATCA